MSNSDHPHTLIRSWHTWISFRVPVCAFLFFLQIRASQARFEPCARAVGGLGPSRQVAELPWGPVSSNVLGCGVHCFLFFFRMDAGTCRPWYTLLEKPTANKIKLTQSKVFCEVTLRFSYLAIHKTHLYSIIGSFRFPLGSTSFWFVRLVPCASTAPLPFPYHIAHVVFCFRPFRNHSEWRCPGNIRSKFQKDKYVSKNKNNFLQFVYKIYI